MRELLHALIGRAFTYKPHGLRLEAIEVSLRPGRALTTRQVRGTSSPIGTVATTGVSRSY